MPTVFELLETRLKEKPLLPPIKEAWREYSILTLLLSGGASMGLGAFCPWNSFAGHRSSMER